MSFIFCVLGGLWRAWFGGGLTIKPLLDCSRFWKYLALVAIVLTMFLYRGYSYVEWQPYAVALAYCIYWAIGHYPWFMILYTGVIDDRDLDLTGKIMSKLGLTERSIKNNLIGLTIRYSLTAVLVSIALLNPLFLIAGLIPSCSYGLSALLLPTAWYTKIGEYLSGGLVTLLLFELV